MAWLLCGIPLFGQDTVDFGDDRFYANRDERLFDSSGAFSTVRTVRNGEPLFILEGGVRRDVGTWGSSVGTERTKVQTDDGSIGWLAVDAISAVNSAILPAAITDYEWIRSYYLDVLRSGHRESLFDHEPFWRDRFYEYRFENSMNGEEVPWYWEAGLSSLYFHSRYTMVYDVSWNFFDLINGRIAAHGNVFSFSFVCTGNRVERNGMELDKYFTPGKRGTMTLSLDGSFLDVSVNGKAMFILVRYTDEIDRQFRNLMMGDPVDLSGIVWPQRADGKPPVDLSGITWPIRSNGSTDYHPLDGTTMPDFQASQKTHGELTLPIRPRDRQSRSQTTDRLRLRENPDTGSQIVTTLNTGMQVQVLETGTTETIGGITAPWVKVLAENGFTGWAFSGYLETLNPETQNQESTNQETENPDSENLNLENPKSSFSVLPFTVTGGAVLVAGIAVAVVLAKRRKGKAEKP